MSCQAVNELGKSGTLKIRPVSGAAAHWIGDVVASRCLNAKREALLGDNRALRDENRHLLEQVATLLGEQRAASITGPGRHDRTLQLTSTKPVGDMSPTQTRRSAACT